MSAPNFTTQTEFDLYVTNNFLSYPYVTDENDDFVMDETGEYVIDYDAEPYFDNSYFDECVEFTEREINSKLSFFRVDFEDGHYTGIQTYINPKYPNDFDALDWVHYPQYYDNSDLYRQFGYNTYILKRKINKEIKLITRDLLPHLAHSYGFDRLGIVAQFSNGETWYEKC